MKAIVALAALFFFAGGSPLAAQEVAAWFGSSPDAAAYADVKGELLSLAESSIATMHSDLPLAERLAEGARKHVAPERLVSTLGIETARLLVVAGDIERRGLLPADPRSSGSMMSQLGIALRAGIEPRDIGAAFDGAIARLGKGPAARDRALAVVSAVAGLSLGQDQRFALVGALAASPLPTARFRGVRGSLADLLARNLTPEQATAALIDSFGARPPALRPTQQEAKSQKADVPEVRPSGAGKPGPSSSSGSGPTPGAGPGSHPSGPGMGQHQSSSGEGSGPGGGGGMVEGSGDGGGMGQGDD